MSLSILTIIVLLCPSLFNVIRAASPTTEEPTSGEPTTFEPTSGEPSTFEPTSHQPTTQFPTTEIPTTQQPTTNQPTTFTPTTQRPTTSEPTTFMPTTQRPTTSQPTTFTPTTHVPTTQIPTTSRPTTQPTTSIPTTESPTTEPTTEEPTTEEPSTEPTTEEPTTAPTAPPTGDCTTQLFAFYTDYGLVNGSILPVLQFTSGNTGFPAFVPFVTVTMDFQSIARIYQSMINALTVYVSYVSIDIPWCISNIVVKGARASSVGLAKNQNCNITDFDLGFSTPYLGRLFIYVNESFNLGNPEVTFYNVSLQPFYDARYIYDMEGILNNTFLTKDEAYNNYRSFECTIEAGSVANAMAQGQFACLAQRIGCNGTRPFTLANVQVSPVPEFQCFYNNLTTGMQYVIWGVYSYQDINTLEGHFGFNTYPQSASVLISITQTFDSEHLSSSPYILLPRTRRQFKGDGLDMTSFSVLFYQGQFNQYQIQYLLSNDPIISQVPCVCGCSMDCLSGQPDTNSTVSLFLNLDNILPIPDAGPDIVLNIGADNFTLNASRSYDPDSSPGPLIVMWVYYGSDPPFLANIPIPDFTNTSILINSSALPLGVYSFILYACDGQAVTYTIFNVTVVDNQVFAIVDPDFTANFTPCTIATNSTGIPLNGNYSYSTNPNYNLTYMWTQTYGPALLPPVFQDNGFAMFLCWISGLFNTTDPVAYFYPPLLGLYIFNLTVTDGITSSSAVIQVQVVAPFVRPVIPVLTLPPFTAAPNRTNPPINRSNITFPNITFPPFPITPFNNPLNPLTPSLNVTGNITNPVNTTVPPLIPNYPPDTVTQRLMIGLYALIAIVLLFLFFALWFALRHEDEMSWLTISRYFHF